MSFDVREFSLHDSRPIEYFKFEKGGKFYYYTPGKRQHTLFSQVYEPFVMKRGGYKQNKDSVVDTSMALEVERDFVICQLFKLIVPETTVWLTIYRKHLGDPDGEARVVWVGRIRGCEWKGGAMSELRAEPITSMVKRAGLRMNYQIGCNHFVYSSSCGVDKGSYQRFGVVSAIEGASVYSHAFAEYPDQWLRLGFVVMGDYHHMIIDHVGDKVTLFVQLEGIIPSETVEFYQGCDRHINTCWDKFNNGPNFGGFAWHPKENIFLTGVGFA